MVLGRSTSLQLIETTIGPHQNLKIVESMDIDDSRPVIHQYPIRNSSPLIKDFLHQRLHIDPHTIKVWHQTDGDGHI
jgi:hypothetical protein